LFGISADETSSAILDFSIVAPGHGARPGSFKRGAMSRSVQAVSSDRRWLMVHCKKNQFSGELLALKAIFAEYYVAIQHGCSRAIKLQRDQDKLLRNRIFLLEK
jgi:hypothetical protein